MGKKSRAKRRTSEPSRKEPEPESGSSFGPSTSRGASSSVPDPIPDPNPTPGDGYNAGDLVYQGLPLVFVVKDDYIRDICHYCLAICKGPHAECTNCNYSRYCGVRCKLDDTYHLYECSMLKRSAPNFPKQFIRYISQAIARTKLDPKGTNGDVLDKYAVTFSDLEICRHRIGERNLYDKMWYDYHTVRQYLASDLVMTFNAFAEVYCKAVRHLCKVYLPSSFRSKAIGLYLGLEFFKHSCVPNAIQTWNGRKLSIRMMESVDRKSPLLITVNMLGYRTLDAKRRKHKIKELCISQCWCGRCEDDELEDMFGKLSTTCPGTIIRRVLCSKNLLKKLTMAEEKDVGKMLKIGNSAWDEMGAEFCNLHVVRAQIARYLCYAYCRLGRFKDSTVFCIKYLQFCEIYYGPNHARTALSYLVLSFLDAMQNKQQTSVKNYEQAMLKFIICLGPDHRFQSCLNSDYCTLMAAGGWTAVNMKKTLLCNCVFKGRAFEF